MTMVAQGNRTNGQQVATDGDPNRRHWSYRGPVVIEPNQSILIQSGHRGGCQFALQQTVDAYSIISSLIAFMFETKRLGYLASLASLRPSGQRFRRFMYSPLCGIESGVSFGQYIHNVRMNGSAGASILHGNCHGNCAGRSNSTAGPNVADGDSVQQLPTP